MSIVDKVLNLFKFDCFCFLFFLFFFSVRDFVGSAKDFYTRSYPLHYLYYILILEKEPVFPF